MFLLPLVAAIALAAPPADLDALVGLAIDRDPETLALRSDADAARLRGRAATRLMDPQLMIGVENLGSMEEYEPTMGMVEATQMFRGWGEAKARSERSELDATRADVDRERTTADVRTRLWQSAARIAALTQQLRLLDDQLRSATALREIALARYAAGADVGGMGQMGGGAMAGMGGMQAGSAMPDMGVSPPSVVPRGGGTAAGMAGMGMGGATTAAAGPEVRQPMPAPPAPTSVLGGSSVGGMATLLRLDAELARVDADRVALERELHGEIRVLTLYVGDEGATAVATEPGAFLGTGGSGVAEARLAAIDVDVARADAAVARAARRPDVMVSVAEMFMTDGMPMATDVTVGVELPLWGGRGREIDAAKAQITAAEAREDRVARDLAVAVEQGRASLDAARARSTALDEVALPRARAAWDATLALFAAGQAREDDVVRAWETWLEIGREAIAARLDVQLRAAELARVEGA